MAATPWRVAIITVVPALAQRYTEIIRSLGHRPVAVIASRRRAPGDDVITLGGPLALEAPEGLDVLFVETRASVARALRAYDVDLGLCTGFPWLLPAKAIEATRLGIVNGHPSLLPRYRGPFPIAWAIRNGEEEIGLTYHLMDSEFDTGNLLAQTAIPIGDDETVESLQEKFSEVTPGLLATVFERLARGDRGDPQQGEGEYQSMFEQEYWMVDPAATAAEVHRQVRAWTFMPPVMPLGPLLERDGGHVRITKSSLVEVEGAERLECADGALWIVETAPL
jgi:methionyl-tRNA formyltransferase